MQTYTKDEFVKEVGQINKFFDLKVYATKERRVELMALKAAVVYYDYGTIAKNGVTNFWFRLDGMWWVHKGRIRCKISRVTFFDSMEDLEADKLIVKGKQIHLNSN